ncbi:uncharacterized protein DNG_07521 [Cephalotrichum gorgonifer]|uniref:Stig1 domain-containing protein n=1 Tax=Cephalotrichum gorgonifer TaxID=2041049 RepID=A0AAE8N1S3_9PEZI|nr:uncharacterized protein DNG_07521 [Cephalotrichum gorgonifer]
MHRFTALLALYAGLLAHSQLLPMNLPSRRPESSLPKGTTPTSSSALRLLLLRETGSECGPDTNDCDSGCIPADGQCCGAGDGGWCSAGTTCVDGGCCPDGADCSGGAARSCGPDHVFCGDKCMPDAAACCAGGSYFCGLGTSCTDDGLCREDVDSGCARGEVSCGDADGCIPAGQVCCSTYYCPRGYECGDADRECAVSSTGGGEGGEGDDALCTGDFVACGDSCMPKGGVCCDGFFCGAGETCAPGRKCTLPDGSEPGDGDDEGEDRTTESAGPTSTTATGGGSSPTGGDDEPGRAGQLGLSRSTLLAAILLLPLII